MSGGAVQGEVDDAIAELERLRRAAEADEAAAGQLRKRAAAAQAAVRQTRCAWHCQPHSMLLIALLCCSMHAQQAKERLQSVPACMFR